jgi:hypothetical protein
MVDIIIKVLEPAASFDLMTLDELKKMMGLDPSDVSQDAQLQEFITQYSDVISVMCNRVFAREKVRETWRCLMSNRVFLSHWPVKEEDIESVECPRGTETTDWELEERSGKLALWGSKAEPIQVTYTGGFELPEEAPSALKTVLEMLIRSGKSQATKEAISGIRSISHKEARVMFYDSGTGGGSAQQLGPLATGMNTAAALLYHFTRFWV